MYVLNWMSLVDECKRASWSPSRFSSLLLLLIIFLHNSLVALLLILSDSVLLFYSLIHKLSFNCFFNSYVLVYDFFIYVCVCVFIVLFNEFE